MSDSSKRLDGKVALVTGASRGIGAAIATRLAREGASVAISYSASPERAEQVVADLQRQGVKAKAYRADQAIAAQVVSLVTSVARDFGRLDILVNSAGVFVTGAVADPSSDVAALDRQFAINVGGVVTAVRAAVPLLSDNGRIISIGSILGAHAPWPGISDYAATKAAVAAYTRGWARDLGARGITVNTVQPGPIDTDMNPARGSFAEVQRAGTALGRYGKPEEIASVVAFLASDDASFVTGATIDVDGGSSA